ncbi:kinase-like domain-containing protein [Dunaliella salina]|uniref:non-specific serine/threonine protein kinase n=1 Tax=Dunaliella salina TaxID=3046 RepID=A0ABQ7GSM7_DUNSA|nr:kinase-like domain-containing protein [Dunaliella salina]|eukprot:KAF5837626.1 kinase-like domain-containing protein [Dunaliella salina]
MLHGRNYSHSRVQDQRELNSKFKVIKFLGKGSYGSVLQVQRLGDGQMYALKEMDVRSMSQAEREDSVNEIRLMASVAHPNVLAYNEAFLDGNKLCIIMEFAPDGDLAKVIKKHQVLHRPVPEDLAWKYFIQVAQGLAALHSLRILHRDIKPGNIMIMANDVAKIGDLGIAKLLKSTMAAKTQIGTPHYMPPEIWRNRPYGFQSDSWALGCLLYEMATLTVPFEARSMNELRYKVLRSTYPPITGGYSRDYIAMVTACLDPNPDRRPSMEMILNSPAVRSRMYLVPREGMQQPPRPASNAGSALLDTIKVPRGNFAAVKKSLPPPNYATDMLQNHGENFRGKPGNISTIQEGDESPDVMEVNHLPPVPSKPPPRPVPPIGGPASAANAARAAQRGVGVPPSANYYAPPVELPPRLRAANAPAPSKMQLPVMNGLGAAYNGQVPASYQHVRSSSPPYAKVESPYSDIRSDDVWKPVRAALHANPPRGPVSESHAAYGAFYNHPQVAARPRVYDAPSAAPTPSVAQTPLPRLNPNPYANRRADAVAGYGAPIKLAPIEGPRGGRAYVAQGMGNPAAGNARTPPIPGRPPPPWNYGAGMNARAAALAYARNLKGANGLAPGLGLHHAHQAVRSREGRDGPSRYPPSQWAPKPLQW